MWVFDFIPHPQQVARVLDAIGIPRASLDKMPILESPQKIIVHHITRVNTKFLV
jgi:hypothetical protein